jgi:hypothetical protein
LTTTSGNLRRRPMGTSSLVGSGLNPSTRSFQDWAALIQVSVRCTQRFRRRGSASSNPISRSSSAKVTRSSSSSAWRSSSSLASGCSVAGRVVISMPGRYQAGEADRNVRLSAARCRMARRAPISAFRLFSNSVGIGSLRDELPAFDQHAGRISQTLSGVVATVVCVGLQ